MTSRISSSFGATDQRVYITNNRVPVFDYNTEVIKNDLSVSVIPILEDISNALGNLGPIGITGPVTVTVSGPIGITGPVSLATGTQVGITGLAGITGSVGVSNFPSSFSVSGPVSLASGTLVGVTGLAGITGSIAVNNFPSSFSVSGPVSLATDTFVGITGLAGVTGSIGVNNFPSSFSVSGPVSLASGTLVGITGLAGITGSIGVNNFPSSFGVSGPVSLESGTLVGITGLAGITGSIGVSNFPSSFGVSGPVSLESGTLVGITGLAGITGSIGVNNFPSSFSVSGPVSLASGTLVGVTGLAGITGSIGVNNFPSSFSVSGPVSLATDTFVGITGLAGVTGSIGVNNFPSSFSVSGPVSLATDTFVGITGLAGVTGSIGVNNFPSSFSVSGPVSLASGTLVGITGLAGITGSIGVNNFPSSFSVSGPVSLATDTFVGITGLVGITGSLSTTITPGTLVGITGAAYNLLNTIETDISSGVLVKGTDDTGLRSNFYVDSNGIQRTQVIPKNIENFSYIFETDLSQIITGSTGFWSVDDRREGWAFDNSGGAAILDWYSNPLSAPPALDFNKAQALWFVAALDKLTAPPLLKVITNGPSVWHYTISPTSALYNGEFYLFYYGSKAIAENLEFRPFLLTRTLISGPGANAETITNAQVITAIPGGVFTLLRAGLWNQDLILPFHTFFKSNAEFTATAKINSLTFSSTNLNVALSNSAKVQIHDGTDTAAVVPTITEISTQNGLCTVSALYGLNVGSGDVFPLTTDISGDLNQLHVKDEGLNSKLVQTYNTNNTTINPGYGINGLNVFQILPKIKTYAMGGTNPNACAADTLFGGSTTTLRVDTTSFGYANQKTFYANIPTGNTARSIKYDYIDASGIEQTATTALSVNAYTTLFTGSGINSFKIAGNFNPGSADLIYVTINNTSTVNNVGSLNIRNHYNGVFTCPANAVAVVTSFDYNLSTAGETFYMHIFDSVGNRQSVYAGYAYQTGVNNFRANPEGLGRMILPLESVCFSSSSTAPTAKFLYYSVTVKYF